MEVTPSSSAAAQVVFTIKTYQANLRSAEEELNLRRDPPPEIAQVGPQTQEDLKAKDALLQEFRVAVSKDNLIEAQKAKETASERNKPSPVEQEIQQAQVRQEADAARRERSDAKTQHLEAVRSQDRRAAEEAAVRDRKAEDHQKQAEAAADAYAARMALQDRQDAEAAARNRQESVSLSA